VGWYPLELPLNGLPRRGSRVQIPFPAPPSLGDAEAFFFVRVVRLLFRRSRQHSVNNAPWHKVPNRDGHSVRRRTQPRFLDVRVNLRRQLGVAVAKNFLSLSEWHRGRRPRPSAGCRPTVRLVWGEWEMREGRRQQRVIQPDAVLDLPTQKRRYFLECEMGTHTIAPKQGNPPRGDSAKADRFQRFLADASGLDGRRTHYEGQYPDGFAPEVLFLVLGRGRAASVNAALAAWQKKGARGGQAPCELSLSMRLQRSSVGLLGFRSFHKPVAHSTSAPQCRTRYASTPRMWHWCGSTSMSRSAPSSAREPVSTARAS
jgi:hypothetical protein